MDRLKVKRSKVPQYKLNLKQLKIIRTERLHLYQREVAEILGVSKSSYVHWEEGHYQPNVTAFLKLVQIFGNEIYEEVQEEVPEAPREAPPEETGKEEPE